jgi:alpha-L-fucosidase
MISAMNIALTQHGEDAHNYIPETDPQALEKIEAWQDLKFGLLMHWGAYSQWGIVESWSLCPEEYGWCERKKGSNPNDYNTYKKEYEDLKTTFNPIRFNPEKWADAAMKAGMKYVVFTTKHHDGFCMFDSKYTDYKVTDDDCPFSIDPKKNIALEIFNAFRDKGLWTGAYFSKPDWHSPYYWDPAYPPRDRNVNYEPEANPEKWEKFTQFTHNQILELMSDYGPMDILWLDGGWVARSSHESIENYYKNVLGDAENGYVKHRMINQDIRMDELVEKARAKQPGLIVVDRAVEGKNQNYLTPENKVPEKLLPYPWESCIISGGGWSYTENAQYMDGTTAIQLLVDIVAKGGNLLLNIAPSPEGEWQQGAYDLLKEFEEWMKVNGVAIYNSRPLYPYKENNVCMTQQKDGRAHFYYLARQSTNTLPRMIFLESHQPTLGSKIRLLGYDGEIKWRPAKNGCKILISPELREESAGQAVWTFEVDELK